jgi:16S rRNA processing protein RimM
MPFNDVGFDGYFYYGKITRTHGIKGHLILYSTDDFLLNKKKIVSFFIRKHDQLVEYPIAEISFTPPTNRFALLNVNTMTDAETFLKNEVFLPNTVLSKNKKEIPYTHQLIGLTVMDSIKGNIGIIEDVLDFPQQKIAKINFNNCEILVPVNPHFIINIDSERKVIHVNLPEGLVDLYLDTPKKVSKS